MVSILDRYQRIAAFYDFLDYPFEQMRYRYIRPQLFAGLSGRILDAGVGTGRNIPFYPAEADVVGVDLSPAMLGRARRRASQVGRPVDLRLMEGPISICRITPLTLWSHLFCSAFSPAPCSYLR